MEHLAWPSALLILGLVFLFRFHAEISALIGRVKGIGKEGISLDGRATTDTTQTTQTSSADDLIRALDNVTLTEQEGVLRKELDDRNISESSDRERVLIRYLAAYQVAYAFERINVTLWASQLALLQMVNVRHDGVEKDELRPFYDLAAKAVPAVEQSYSFDAYLDYLLTHRLLVEDAGRYQITFLGRDFITYIVHRGHAGPRHL